MKSVLGLVVAMMLVAPGCGDDTTSSTTPDQSVPVDMTTTTTPPKDMTKPLATTCAGALACVTSGCLADSDATAQEACANACAAGLSGTEKTDYTSLFTCVVQAATVMSDAGTKIDPNLAGKSIAAGGACQAQAAACEGIGLDK